jgi:hypothetical protein
MAEKKGLWHRLVRLLELVHLWTWIVSGALSLLGLAWGVARGRGEWVMGLAIGLAFCVAVIAVNVFVVLFRRRRQVLAIEPSIEGLSYAYPAEPGRSHNLISAGLAHRGFAILTIRNEGRRDLRKVVARCSVTESGVNVPCFWSSTADGRFTVGGGESADLDVWHARVLVIAQVFRVERLWTRLSADPDNLFHPVAIREKELAHRIGESRIVSPAGERLDLAGKAELTVNFGAADFRHTERFLLSFDAEGPTLSRAP